MMTSSNGNIFHVTGPLCGEFRAVISARINGWLNNDEAGDLRRHRAHYDVTNATVVCLWKQHQGEVLFLTKSNFWIKSEI